MKAFAVSLILLLLIIVLACANAAYVRHTAETMKELAVAAMQKSSDTAVSELKGYWNKHKKFITLSAHYKQIDLINEELLRFEAAYSFSDDLAAAQSLAILCNALDTVSRCERLCWHSIL